MNTLDAGYNALVIGAHGGIGSALVANLKSDPNCAHVVGLSRQTEPMLDITREDTIAHALQSVASQGPFHLILIATGALTIDGRGPEKRLADLNAEALARYFAVNAIGPALVMKHAVDLLPRSGRSFLGAISARVGSIGDNKTGGWYGYRASKAALNMLIKTTSIEVARKRPEAIVAALHPGTVRTSLSAAFAGTHTTFSTDESASFLLNVLDGLPTGSSGSFHAWDGETIEW